MGPQQKREPQRPSEGVWSFPEHKRGTGKVLCKPGGDSIYDFKRPYFSHNSHSRLAVFDLQHLCKIYICVCVYIYIYICMHTHTYTHIDI